MQSTDRFIGLDLDGVIRHNNKSLGTGDIAKSWRTRELLLGLWGTKEYDSNYRTRMPDKYYITHPGDILFIDGALETLALFELLDINQYVFTNQEAIGLGIMTVDDWHLVREVMDNQIQVAGGCIDSWYWCPHFPDEDCECRKPKPGMLLDFASDGADLSKMVFVGDNPSDMEAACRAGCGYKIHIILDGADEEFKHSEFSDETATSLKDAVVGILNWVFQV